VITVFLGPTLRLDAARALLEADYRPPAAQGDVYRAALREPDAIAIIDGRFEQVPPVWHKEILWALSRGIAVYGSSSMGALRAAELHTFGMRGVGAVFEQFRDGALEDDDEVAVQHGPAEFGYPALSDAMVNIRATLAGACAAGVIDEAARVRLTAAGKSLYFPDRNYEAVLGRGAPELTRWIAQHRLDVKRDDAVALLHILAAGAAPPAPAARFEFQSTALWAELVRFAETVERGDDESERRPDFMQALVQAGQRKGLVTPAMREAALARVLGLDESYRHGLAVDPDAVGAAVLALRRRLQLWSGEQLARWMDENDLDLERFLRLAEEEARLGWVRSMMDGEIDAALPRYLRAAGEYAAFRRHAGAPDGPVA
jgi:hypothetical protein